MNEKKQNNDLIKEIIEKHFENMVDDILEQHRAPTMKL